MGDHRIMKEITGRIELNLGHIYIVKDREWVEIADWMSSEAPGLGKYVKVVVQEVPGE